MASDHRSSDNWFKTDVKYEGEAYAELISPEIKAEGSAEILFSESGESTIIMKLENIIFQGNPIGPEIREFLSRKDLTVPEYAKLSKYLRQIENNRCSKFVVKTKEGNFLSEGVGNILYYNNDSYLIFSFLKSQFTTSNELQPKYWVLPLLNFVSEFSQGSPRLEHPLRINSLDDRVIKFEFDKQIAFIEPLPDYSDRKEHLYNGIGKNKITSVMVGELGDNSIELENLGKWFPFGFLGVLGVATGSEVSASWIEFRSQDGHLVRRVHPSLRVPCFFRGHVAIDELFNIGIGSLLTNFQSISDHLDPLKELYFTAAMENLIKGGLYDLTSEDKLSYIFRGLDGLCEKYNLKANDLRTELEPEQKDKVERIVNDAIELAETRLSSLEKEVRSEGKEHQGDNINAILRKMKQNQPYFDTSYGRAVVRLLHKFHLNDAEVVESYYESNPRWDRRKWIQVLPYYRGKTMHSGYFKFHENANYREDVPRISNHLHDILLRIILKMLDYKGTYHSTVKRIKSTDNVDWVLQDTKASELGY